MLKVKKEENWYGYDNIIIETEEGMFTIFFSNSGDLDWCVTYVGQRLNIPDKYNFIITKDNNYLYDSFEKLYDAIKNNKPFSNNSFLDDENKNIEIPNNELFKDGKIEWHSDNFPYDEASILTISKDKDNFDVEFKISDNRNLFSTLSVTICNSGSRYSPYNATFMNMYNNLLEYDFENEKRQIVSVFGTDDKKKIKKL